MGTRPEAIKLAPLAKALDDRGCPPLIIATGQHQDLDLRSHALGQFERIDLGRPGLADPYVHAHGVETALRPILAAQRPPILVVQGDTSSAYGAARAAFLENVPVAHVEAGLRTYDPARPWPEEEFRSAIDARAEILFAPTETAAGNLRREGARGAIHVTGNTGIDALLSTIATLPSEPLRDVGTFRILVTCHRRESWKEGIARIAEAVRQITLRADVEIDVVVHPNPVVALQLRASLAGLAGINLHPPTDHDGLVFLMRRADLVLSDSGGVQEEAPTLGVPLLILRDKTERPEALEAGNALLVGANTDAIVSTVLDLIDDRPRLLRMARPTAVYGDGHAGPRIARILLERVRR